MLSTMYVALQVVKHITFLIYHFCQTTRIWRYAYLSPQSVVRHFGSPWPLALTYFSALYGAIALFL